ncbi:MAG: heme-binding protein [Archangium sp.]|nr:heme-binding protein [Archangium sp.]
MQTSSPLSVVGALVTTLLGAPAMALEMPKHEVVDTFEDFEVRRYTPYVVAETRVEGERSEVGNEAFSRLAGYIFGKNRGARKIAMTAPVAQAPAEGQKIAMTAPVAQAPAGEGAWVVQFMMPSEFSLETLPEPNDPRVSLRLLPARTFAVVRYSGTWSKANYEEHLEQLKAGLQREGLVAKGEPVWARYNPPFTPWFLRTNEILIEVEARQAPLAN